MVYNFKADPSGTALWHAHFHSQNVDGLYGPFIVNDELGSFPFHYDEEKVILMTDSYDQSSWALEQYMTTPPVSADQPHTDPTPNQGLICLYDESKSPAIPSCSSTSSGTGFNLNFETGKTYRLRLVGAADLAPFLFSIDEHQLQVVAVDYAIVDGSAWVNSIPITVGYSLDMHL